MERRPPIHHELEKLADHARLYQVCRHLEVCLRHFLQQDEVLGKVAPVGPSAVHHLVDEEADEAQGCRPLHRGVPQFAPLQILRLTVEVVLLLYLAQVLLLILHRDRECIRQQRGELLAHFWEVRAQ